ncbi:MAG: TonB-dependent receptor [Opitutaceae bacterium]
MNRSSSLFFVLAAAVLSRGASPNGAAADPAATLDTYTVTGTRERALLRETPASVGVLTPETIRQTAPLHPGQLLGQFPGVAVAVTNGEGHTTAIRQPFTTSPLYLFLEDGIPVRPTGFFNHNALYEVNLPQAGGVEVVRGPGTALHGSDAIGGIVNILSRAPEERLGGSLLAEAGSHGVRRFLLGASAPLGGGGARLDANLTHTDGWRLRTAYDRRSLNGRWDRRIGERTTLRGQFGWSDIDQQTGANSALPLADYLNDPTRNNFAIAFRRVEALRASLELEHRLEAGTLTFTPYARRNGMDLLATFNLSSDPRIDRSLSRSLGALLKWRQLLPGASRTRLIAGLDLDRSPGTRVEDNLLVTRTGSGASTRYTCYTTGTRIYDYEVLFRSVSPYVHTETSLGGGWRVSAGLRHDRLGFDQTNHLPAGTVTANVLGATRHYGQLPGQARDFSSLSPKLGATWSLHPALHFYGSFNHGFRAPSESQLYRAGNDTTAAAALNRARLAADLRPIRARQAELGARGELRGWSAHLVAYRLEKRDDLVSQRDLATNVTTSVNAGRTRHTGVEAGFGGPLPGRLRFDAAVSRARHTYVDGVTATANFTGREMESAPRVIASARLGWTPVRGTFAQAEWTHLGPYWLEAGNSPVFGKYPGHPLLNLRASRTLTARLTAFGRVMNTLDRRFADSASVSSNTPVFTPGLPRTFHAGLEYAW